MNDEQKIIGYTTGVFDLFHVGHLRILQKAKEQCNYLIVGVSTDELVQEYKHKTPIIPFEQRIEIIKSIRYVDEVVPQTSLDKYLVWEKRHYDKLFHGNDWKGSVIFSEMEKKLKKAGVEIIYFPYTNGISSSQISQKLTARQPR